ncbi:MAG: hypothetical protein J6K78_02665, partial [Tidjanibacter sp.]|nr:hypothetical protein [Tidjanibacter sp.]
MKIITNAAVVARQTDLSGAAHHLSCSARPPSAISTTPPDLLLGEAAERNFGHPSRPPARRGRRAQFRPPLPTSCSARPP